MFQRVLVPLDGSSRAEKALPIAASIARASKGSVLLVNVVDTASNVWAAHIEAPLQSHMFLDREHAGAEKYLKQVMSSSVFTDIKVETLVTFGSIASTLLSVMTSTQADLIVLCSHGYTRVARWLLGSTAEFVIRHAPVPVLLLREGDSTLFEHGSGRHVSLRTLVTLDGSSRAEEALAPAASLVSALATPAHSELHLLQVVKPGTANDIQDPVEKAHHYLSGMKECLRKDLNASSNTNSCPNVTHSVAVDVDIVEAIVETAEWDEREKDGNISGGYDMIAMATTGRKGLQWWTMGSVTESVLNMTTLPLLIVPPASRLQQNGEALQETKSVAQQKPVDENSRADNDLQGIKKDFPLTRPGAIYPDNYIMAVFKDEKKAEDAVQALLQAGVASEDIRLFESHEVLDHAEDTERNKSLFARIADAFQTITSDEDQHVLIYVEEARRGHAILNVHVPESEQVESVKDILVAHSARNIKYFGRWSISILHH